MFLIKSGHTLTQAPHIDGGAVLQAENHLRGAIEPRLDVRVDFAIHIAWAAKVDDLNRAATTLFEQDVFLKFRL